MSQKHPLDHYQKQMKILETAFQSGEHQYEKIDKKRDGLYDGLSRAAEEIHKRIIDMNMGGTKLKTVADYLKLDDTHLRERRRVFEMCSAQLLQLDKMLAKEVEGGKKHVGAFQKLLKELRADTATLPKGSPDQSKWSKLAADYQTLDKDYKNYFRDVTDKFKPCNPDKLKKNLILNQPVSNKFVEFQLEDSEL